MKPTKVINWQFDYHSGYNKCFSFLGATIDNSSTTVIYGATFVGNVPTLMMEESQD